MEDRISVHCRGVPIHTSTTYPVCPSSLPNCEFGAFAVLLISTTRNVVAMYIARGGGVHYEYSWGGASGGCHGAYTC